MSQDTDRKTVVPRPAAFAAARLIAHSIALDEAMAAEIIERELRKAHLPPDRVKLNTPDAVTNLLVPEVDGLQRERFFAFALDKRHAVLAREHWDGASSSCVVDIASILRFAITTPRCCGILVAHNHPSGVTDPSQEDRNITRVLSAACRTVGLPLVDHVILTAAGLSYSFASRGEM